MSVLIPQCEPLLSTHQYVEVVDATSAGRDTATAYELFVETQLVEPPEELTSAAAIAFSTVALWKTLEPATPGAGHAAGPPVPLSNTP